MDPSYLSAAVLAAALLTVDGGDDANLSHGASFVIALLQFGARLWAIKIVLDLARAASGAP